MRYLRAVSAILVVGVLSNACGDSTGPENLGFDATISGDLQESISGDAIFGVASEGGVDRWMIFLSSGAFLQHDFEMIGFTREASGTPIPVGTHTISNATSSSLNDDDITAAYMTGRDNGGSLGVFLSVSGTLTITSANSDYVTGSFQFTVAMSMAWGDALAGVENLTLNGTFTAEAGTIPSGAASS